LLAAGQTDESRSSGGDTLLRLRALFSRAHSDAMGYPDYRARFCAMAESLGFEGHIA
jgi:hypothetical protein